MSKQTVENINIVGVAVRTSNAHGKAEVDIPNLWQRFISESIASQIENKIGEDTYCVYTEYEGDHNNPYTIIIGCPVPSLEEVPEGLKGISIQSGVYQKFVAKGNVMQGIIWEKWNEIWHSNIKRAYHTDFEVYGQRAQNPEEAEVDIFVGTK